MRANEFIKEDHGRMDPIHDWEKELANRLSKWFSPIGAWKGFKNVVGIGDDEGKDLATPVPDKKPSRRLRRRSSGRNTRRPTQRVTRF